MLIKAKKLQMSPFSLITIQLFFQSNQIYFLDKNWDENKFNDDQMINT